MEARHYPGKRHGAPASLALLVLGMLAGCGGPSSAVRPSAGQARTALPAAWPIVEPDRPAAASEVLMRALSLVGTPYRYGGNTPESGFDCSGLVGYVFKDALAHGLPRTSAELGRTGVPIGPLRMAAGDLVVFGAGGAVNHVGIYVGEGRFVHAPNSGGTVRLDRVDGPYWRDHFAGARRVLQ